MKDQKPRQQQPRMDLARIVETHLNAAWRRPIAEHSAAAFESIRRRVEESSRPLVIDSCCGTGDSTRHLAETLQHALVLGIDKSAHRLARHQAGDDSNYLILRADVNDFWRLAQQAGWQPARQYLFYPNPYPKASQVRKRWYASPAFPVLLNLGGLLTVRTNWQVYAEEFVLALNAAGVEAALQTLNVEVPVSAFETKYQARGHELFEVTSDLSVFPRGLV